MKTTIKIFSFFFAVAALVACAGAESEQLKQARTIQETMLKSKGNLDSLVDVKMNELSARITELSADSTLATDSLKTATYTSIKSQLSDIESLKSKLSDWMSNVKMLPTVEEIAKGAENPFGDGAKDQDILKAIQDNQKQFDELKSEIETAIQ
jgi:cell division protein YceG involved in septum cleavage